MALVPLGDNVIIKRCGCNETESSSLIILPDSAKPTVTTGKVLAIGDGRLLPNGKRASMQVNEGDRVLFDPYQITVINLDGEEYLIVSESAIMGVYR